MVSRQAGVSATAAGLAPSGDGACFWQAQNNAGSASATMYFRGNRGN
jgi:hypothetical protein